MMTITEKVAYLKGLADGMKLSAETNEGKLLLAVIDTLEDMALTVSDMEDSVAELSAQVDEIDDDLGSVEEDLYGDECDCDDEDDDEDFDDTLYEVECPNCGAELDIDESILEAGTVECPGCGSKFAIDLTDDEDECCCGHHHGHCHDEAGERSEEK